MFLKKLALSLALIIVPSFGHLVVNSSLRLEYSISYRSIKSLPEITVNISGVSQNTLDLIVSPMTSFDMERRGDADTWLVDEIHAYAPDGTELSVTGPETVSVPYTLLPLKPHYHHYHVHTLGNDHITLRYRATVPIVVGYLETLLLRPYQHQQIGATMLRFDIPQGWQAVTVVTPRADAQFDLGMLDSMYGDNLNPAFNFVPMAFAVGSTKDITEIPTSCGRLIFAYPDMYYIYESPDVFEQQVELGKRFFEFLCREVGPLEPYRTFIANNNWQEDWMLKTYQPGLYSFFWQHNRTMDWSSGIPSLQFSPWRFGTLIIGTSMVDEPNTSYYHLPHALTRAWFKGSTYFVLSPSQADWFVRGGASGYFQEKMLYEAFGPIKVYQRFQETYEFYKQQYLGTPQDRPLMSSGDKFNSYFKSELWAFYANQRILEATHGERDLGDAIRWLYAKFGGTGKAYTYQDVQMAINITAKADLSDLIQVYAYTTAPLPLDSYFQDDDQDGLMNGLEAERRTNPESADSDGDGVDDSVEYATECIQVSLNPIYCTEVIPPDAKGNLPTPPAAAIITNAPLSIMLDGISSDWPEISPLDTDPQESGPYDFAALYAFSDENYLYLRIDPYGYFSSDVPGQFTFDIVAHGESQLVFQAFTISNQPEEIHLAPIVDNVPQFNLQKIYRGSALDRVFELVIPLAYLGYPERVTIHAYVNAADQPTSFDSFEKVDYAIETATPIITITPLSIATTTVTSTPASTPTNTPPRQPVESSSLNLLRAVLILGAVTILVGVVLFFRKMRR